MLDIWKTALSENVRQQLYDILDLSDELFYNKTLLKCEKKKKKKGTTNTATDQGNANTIQQLWRIAEDVYLMCFVIWRNEKAIHIIKRRLHRFTL